MIRMAAKILILSLLLMSVLPLSGCGMREKAEKAATKKIIEGITGAKVDIDKDVVTITGEDGEKVSIGGDQWPDSDLAKKIPEFTKGTIATTTVADEGVMIYIEKVNTEDFEAYLEKIKKTYTEDVYELRSAESITFAGCDGDATNVAVSFLAAEQTMGITVTKADE